MTAPNPFRCYVMGSESLLVQCSEILLEEGHKIRGVITASPEIQAWAEGRDLSVIAPGKGLAQRIGDDPFEWLFSIANLSIIPDDVLAKPTSGAINFHDGPLPRYAGVNATSWAILQGERAHGVTWHLIEGGVDEGDILEQATFELDDRETALTLNTRCYEAGIRTFGALVGHLGRGQVPRRPQDLSERTYFGKHERPSAACTIDWEQPAHRIDALVRALDYGRYPNPIGVPKVVLERGALLLPRARRAAESTREAPGTVLAIDDQGLEVATATGSLLFGKVLNAEGDPLTPEAAFAMGVEKGARLAAPEELRTRLSAVDTELAKHERFWIRRLSSSRPAALPRREHGGRDGTPSVGRCAIDATAEPVRLLAALALWLDRVSGAEGVYDVGHRHLDLPRRLSGAEAIYADRVPLRLRIDGEQPFEALQAAIRRELDEVRSRGSYLRDVYVREPALRRPRWEIVFDVVEDVEAYELPDEAAVAIVTDGELASLLFDPARLTADAANDLRRRLSVLLEQAESRPDVPVRQLSLLSEQERRRILLEWNDTARDYRADRGVHQLFEEQALRTPSAVALVHRADQLTFAELDRRANQLAHRLVGLGVGPDTPVGLCTDRGPELMIGALGILKAGGAYVPLDPTYPAERLAFMVQDSEAPVLVTQSARADLLPESDAAVIRLDDDPELARQPADRPRVEGFDSTKLAYLIYTSGSTGTPKGVMVEHRNVAAFFAGMDERIPHDPPGRWLAVTSLSFDISVLELFWTLARGFTVVLTSDEDRALVSGGGPAVSEYQHRKIDFGLFYFASDEGEKAQDKYRLLLEGARFADRHGFSAVWTPERHFHAFGGLYPNPAVTSAGLATITDNVQLRAGSCVNPLHHPIRVAEEWALVDNLSKGRVGISFASGWQPNDFVLRPESFEDNKARMVEEIDVIRRLWRGETLTFEGPKGPVEVRTLPRPVQPELPFFITAAGNPKTFEMAGQLGGGILTHLLGQSLEEAEDKIRIYRDAWRKAGHPGEGTVVLMLHTFVGPDEDAVKEIVREPMKNYLRSSMMLIQKHAWSFPAFKRLAKEDRSFKDNFLDLSPEETEALLDHSFERYYETSSLFGTPDSCMRTIDDCRRIGVDEVACLIDFGIASETVLEHLPHLERLRAQASPAAEPPSTDDYSIAAQIERHRVTHMQCTPSMARMLVMNDEARAALSNVQHLMIGGEAFPGPLAAELRRATNASITNMYGPTETTIWSATGPAEPCDGTVAIGTPIANTQLYVLDEHREPVPVGVPGELYIGGDAVTRGYHQREELTRERFVPDPFSEREGARLYRTGDLVRWRSDGTVEFLGRIDHQVKLRGYRIELGEIEARLMELDGVREAAVIAREDTPGDKRLVAYVAPEGRMDVSSLKQQLGESLPEFMVPSRFVRMDRLPLTPNKKIDRNALPRPDAQPTASSAERVAPEGETERTIAGIWKRILGLDEVGTRDNFFELGGHSLLAVQAHREIREATGAELTVTDIFRFPTIAALAEHVDGARGPSETLQRSADRAAARRQAVGRRRVVRRR